MGIQVYKGTNTTQTELYKLNAEAVARSTDKMTS